MSFQEKIASLLQQTVQEKDEEIKNLKEQNERLREENEKLKQIKSSDSQFTSNRFGEVKNRAVELKKVLDEFLEHPNRPMMPRPYISPISIPNSNVDANKPSTSTNEPSKIRSGPADESSATVTNHINHVNRTNYNNQEDFGVRQDFRSESDTDIVVQATQPQPEETLRQQHYNGHNVHAHNIHPHSNLNLPTASPLNGNNGRRFNSNNHNGFSLNGLNNNNNNNRNRNSNHHNNNSGSKYTIFISWPGSVTIESLRELFDTCGIDVADIRYTAPKQFAHVDLKSEVALNKAISLNGETKDNKQGQLRVEVGKPRSSNNNTTENGPRTQNQNKNFNRQNNKNVNGYNNNNLTPKHNKQFPYNNHNNHNNHNHNNSSQYQPSFTSPDEKESNIIPSWNGGNFTQEVTKD